MDSDAKAILAFAFGLAIGCIAMAIAGLPETQRFLAEIQELENEQTMQQPDPGLLPILGIVGPIVILFGLVHLALMIVRRQKRLPPVEEEKDGPG